MNADSSIVEEVRRRAYELSERFGHDLDKYIEHLLEIQAQHAERVVNQVAVVRAPVGVAASSKNNLNAGDLHSSGSQTTECTP